MDHQDRTGTDREYRDDSPFGARRRPRGGSLFETLSDLGSRSGLGGPDGLGGNGLLERIMNDVSSWFEEDGRQDSRGSASAAPAGHGRSGTTDGVATDATSRAATAAGATGADVEAFVDEYADEGPFAGASHRGRGPRNYRRSDERIGERVSETLLEDAVLDARDIDVAVADGEVTLSGTVATRRQKHRAENLAARVGATRDVDNRLRVRAETHRDASAVSPGGRPGDPSGDPADRAAGEARRDADDYGHPS